MISLFIVLEKFDIKRAAKKYGARLATGTLAGIATGAALGAGADQIVPRDIVQIPGKGVSDLEPDRIKRYVRRGATTGAIAGAGAGYGYDLGRERPIKKLKDALNKKKKK